MNHYAVEIFSLPSDAWYGVTNTSVGLVNGVFRFVTDHPLYDGSTVVPTYGPDEIDVNGNSVGGATNPYVWYEGILVDESINGNPTRSIDISIAGSYSTDSSFSFQTRGDAFINVSGFPTPFWEWCQENNVSFIGRTTVIWTVIDNVFCQMGRGKISDNPQEEDNYEFDVEDEASTLHKNMPSLVSNPTNIPGGPDSGICFPIVFGEVVNSKLLKLDSANHYIQLHNKTSGYNAPQDLFTTAALSYSINGTTKQGVLSIINQVTSPFPANYFQGAYLFVVSGLHHNDSKMYRIASSDASVADDEFFAYYTDLYIDDLLIDDKDPPMTVGSPSGNVPTFNGVYTYIGNTGANLGTMDMWWFKISAMSINTVITQCLAPGISNGSEFGGVSLGQDGLPTIKTWDSSSKSYIDISSLVHVDSSVSKVVLISNFAAQDGKVQISEKINFPGFDAFNGLIRFGVANTSGQYWNTSEQYLHYSLVSDLVSLQRASDRLRSPAIDFTGSGWFDANGRIWVTAFYNIAPLTVTYDNIYLLADMYLDNFSGLGGPARSLEFGKLAVNMYDVFGNDVPHHASPGLPAGSVCNLSPDYSVVASPASPLQLNIIDNIYYAINNIRPDPKSFFGSQDASNKFIVGTYFDLSNQVLGKACITSPFVHSISFHIGLLLLSLRGSPLTFDVHIKEIAILGVRQIDSLGGDIYVGVTGGEKTNVSGAVSTDPNKITNDVYHAIMHIIEDLDSIPKGLIDYGTLATDRGPGKWHVGRTIEDRKNSIDYLGELFSHSFIGGFTGRTGKRTMRSWISTTIGMSGNPVLTTPVVTTGNGKTTTHDNFLIVDQSIESWQKTDVSSVYNSFNLRYNYDPGSGSYLRNFIVSALGTLATFPDANQLVGAVAVNASGQASLLTLITSYSLIADSLFYLTTTSDTLDDALATIKGSALVISDAFIVNPDGITATYEGSSGMAGVVPAWFQAFGGLFNMDLSGYPANNTAYAASKQIWDLCRNSYLQTQKILQAQSDIGELPWFIDRSLFDSTATWGTGTQSSAFLLLTLLAIWATKQKDVVTYSIPLNANTYGTELLDCINFSDVIYTGSVNRIGWVTGIEVDVNNDQLKITATLLPADVTTIPVTPPVVENVTFPAGSNMSTARANPYITPGQSHVAWGTGQDNIGTLVYTTNNPPTGDDDYTIDATKTKVILNPTKWYDSILANTLGLLNVDTW